MLRMKFSDRDETGRKRPGSVKYGIHHTEVLKTKNDQMLSLLSDKVWA